MEQKLSSAKDDLAFLLDCHLTLLIIVYELWYFVVQYF